MQSVFRLFKNLVSMRFKQFIADFFAAVRRQAVQHHCFGFGNRHHRTVQAIAAERLEPGPMLGFMPHARPHVGHQDVGASRRFTRIIQYNDATAGFLGGLLGDIATLIVLLAAVFGGSAWIYLYSYLVYVGKMK